MVATITNLRSLRGMGILADRNARSPSLEFRRYNLIYGFNGSGKSTLSRLFASLEAGAVHPKLPHGGSFEVVLDDRSHFGCPSKPNGLEGRLLVFNSDYVEQNLQWAQGLANPVFFIGADQTEAAAQLAKIEVEIDQLAARKAAADAAEKAADKTFGSFKRERARLTASRLHLGNRKYEAPALARDYEAWKPEDSPLLTDSQLKAAEDTRRLASPPPELTPIAFDVDGILKAYQFVSDICGQSLTVVALEEAQRFPEMLLWLKQGHEFHAAQELNKCLLCGNTISTERKALLSTALDTQIDQFIAKLAKIAERLGGVILNLVELEESLPASDTLVTDYRSAYKETRAELVAKVRQVRKYLSTLQDVLAQKQERPASPADTSRLAEQSEIAGASDGLAEEIRAANSAITQHNEIVGKFASHQEAAEFSIRKHFIAECRGEYVSNAKALEKAQTELRTTIEAFDNSNTKANDLKQKIRTHGPAAESINNLIASYLGHRELSIHPVDQGYELHRHGKAITGAPSEGEKTAIAISYFLSSIEAEGRKLKNMIVVVDDPVSSLDTKALNFACALVRSRLSGAAQLFILTHNQHCMNEFRKAWKGKTRPNPGQQPTAHFLFIDVTIPSGQDRRSSTLGEMSRLLREYDSEYHYLFSHVLTFADNPDEYHDHGYMMPNVLRRVLDVFLAFKCPGSAGLSGQLDKLCKDYPDLDKDRVTALERLAQVESHSDNLDDLLSFSSMTLEEVKGATAALLHMIEHVDNKHLMALRRLCR